MSVSSTDTPFSTSVSPATTRARAEATAAAIVTAGGNADIPTRRKFQTLLLSLGLVLVLFLQGSGPTSEKNKGTNPPPPSTTTTTTTPGGGNTIRRGTGTGGGLSQQPPVTFNVIVTTAGRDTLGNLLKSISPQLLKGDHLTVISDKGHEFVASTLATDIDCACTVRHIANPEPLGFWGHGSRSRWQNELPGDFHMNADDDDIYDPEAMNTIRRVIANQLDPPTLYVFHMIRRWDQQVELIPPRGFDHVEIKKIGTPCGVYRKIPDLPPWHGSYGGDGGFYVALSDRMEVRMVDEVIYQVGQSEWLFDVKNSVS